MTSASDGTSAIAEALRDVGTLVDVDLLHAQRAALLAGDVREQALHPPRRARAAGREEDEQRDDWSVATLEVTVAEGTPGTLAAMGAWYWIGVSVGLGAAAGVLVAGFAARVVIAAVVVAAAASASASAMRSTPGSPAAGAISSAERVGGLAGALGALQIVRGALRRGGTAGGTAALVAVAALIAAGLAWIPAVGYLEALALPVLAARLRRRAPERYAGLRTLAK